MSWNTGMLVYDGQTLDMVFRDLKKVYNMDIVADDPWNPFKYLDTRQSIISRRKQLFV